MKEAVEERRDLTCYRISGTSALESFHQGHVDCLIPFYTQVWAVGEAESQQIHSVDALGHRSGIRAVALSSDNSLLLSAAESSVKIWNTRTHARLRHIDIDHGLSATFAPGLTLHEACAKSGFSLQFHPCSSETLQTCVTTACHLKSLPFPFRY